MFRIASKIIRMFGLRVLACRQARMSFWHPFRACLPNRQVHPLRVGRKPAFGPPAYNATTICQIMAKHDVFLGCCFLCCIIFSLTGCATYYKVNVNGFVDRLHWSKEGLREDGRFWLEDVSSSKNSLLAKEIKEKMEYKLVAKNFLIASSQIEADYELKFHYAISQAQERQRIEPVFQPGETGYYETYSMDDRSTKRTYITFPGKTTYIPTRETVYTATLTLNLFDHKRNSSPTEGQEVWIGEISLIGTNSDLRDVIPYLLEAGFRWFGQDTGKRIVVPVLYKHSLSSR